jgi:hypothetical protein
MAGHSKFEENDDVMEMYSNTEISYNLVKA